MSEDQTEIKITLARDWATIARRLADASDQFSEAMRRLADAIEKGKQ